MRQTLWCTPWIASRGKLMKTLQIVFIKLALLQRFAGSTSWTEQANTAKRIKEGTSLHVSTRTTKHTRTMDGAKKRQHQTLWLTICSKILDSYHSSPHQVDCHSDEASEGCSAAKPEILDQSPSQEPWSSKRALLDRAKAFVSFFVSIISLFISWFISLFPLI